MENDRHEKRFVSFVSQDDEKFRTEEKNIADQTSRGKSDMSFGAQELGYHRSTENSVQRMQDRVASGGLASEIAEEMIREDRERTGESLHRDFKLLFAWREKFSFRRTDISLMLTEALRDAQVRASWGQEGGAQDEEEFWELFNKGEIPSSVFAAILEQRERRQEQLQQEWNERFEMWRGQFRLQLQFAVSEGIIPPNDHYDDRIADVQFLVADPVAMGTTVGRSHGAGILSVQVEFREESAVRKTLFHEMTHHIAGGAIQKTDVDTYQHNSLRWQSTQYTNRKHGLAFNANRGFRENGSWLNEGVTELLARHLAKEDAMTSYPYEQTTILAMIKSGVPQELFINAYFEGHRATPENGSRLPAFRALSKKITELYGTGWLKDFGKLIDRNYEELLREDAP